MRVAGSIAPAECESPECDALVCRSVIIKYQDLIIRKWGNARNLTRKLSYTDQGQSPTIKIATNETGLAAPF